jgi:hypothetical protein
MSLSLYEYSTNVLRVSLLSQDRQQYDNSVPSKHTTASNELGYHIAISPVTKDSYIEHL